MKEIRRQEFANGKVYCFNLKDDMPIEVTDTFLPFYTKNAINEKSNKLKDFFCCDRSERWMIGVSCMSGCPVKCKFCATSKLKKWRSLGSLEITSQIMTVLEKSRHNPKDSMEFKINYTRMGEPFLNIHNVKDAIRMINLVFPDTHHYLSTIGIKDADFSWIKGNITLQISLHSLDESRRNWLIPYKNKMTLRELGQIRTGSNQKTTINLTLVDYDDFDINKLKEYFDPEYFFIKLSPINENKVSAKNNIGAGIIKTQNLI